MRPQKEMMKTESKSKMLSKCIKKKEKRKLFQYSEETLRRALFEVRENKISIRQVSREFGVPKTTIVDRLKGRVPDNPGKTGPEPLLTRKREKQIADWLVNIAKCGFPVTKVDLLDTVENILKTDGNTKLFKNGRPGEKWYSNFLRRHPEISLREAESINKARAIVTEERIRLWFQELKDYLEANNLTDILENPDRIMNGDETGMSLSPKSGKVLAPKGWKNLYVIKKGNEKENITVLIVFTASGKVCPPLVVFPYLRPPRAVVENMPPGWVLGKSESGWMRGDVFYEYISNDFNKWITENEIKRPVLLLIDGHRSHMTLALSEFCAENGIVLYALPANTTHILQPADVSVFKPLKQQWKNTIRKWQGKMENINKSVTKTNFCQVFYETLSNVDMESHIRNGFRKCGLFPLNPDNIDFTKCVKNILEKQNGSIELNPNVSQEIAEEDLKSAEKVIKKIKDKLYSYGINVEVILNEINFLRESEEIKTQPTIDDQPNSAFHINSTKPEVESIEYVPNNVGSSEEISTELTTNNYVDDCSVVPKINIQSMIIIPLNEVENAEMIESNDILGNNYKLDQKPLTISNVSSFVPCSSASNLINVGNITDGDVFDKDFQPGDNPIIENFVLKESTVNIQNASIESIEDKPNSCNLNFEHSTSKDDIASPPDAPQCCTLNFGSLNESSTSRDAFEFHLTYPDPVVLKKPSSKQKKLPSAISSDAWRNYYAKKDEEKQSRLEKAKIRREQKTIKKEKQTETEIKRSRRKKLVKVLLPKLPNKENASPNINNDSKKKIYCTACDDILDSDTDNEENKNIGCDYCPNWYHLGCTELIGISYEEAAIKDYKCHLC